MGSENQRHLMPADKGGGTAVHKPSALKTCKRKD